MTWAAVVSAMVIIAAAVYYFKGRQRRRGDFRTVADTVAERSFYPEIEKCHAINTKSITCSCADFRKEREQFRHDDPRRLCKHLVRSFIDADSLPEDLILYKEGIRRSHESHSGFPTDKKRFDAFVCGKRISIMVPETMSEEDPWIDVYCDAGRYSYSPESGQWANGTSPSRAMHVIKFVHEKIGRPLPDSWHAENEEVESPGDGMVKHETPADSGHDEFCDVESLLRAVLPPDGELALKETKSYLAVTFNGSRKWICRLHLNSKKSKYIEFPDGRRYALNGIKDIGRYREQLLDAYGEQSPRKRKARMLFPMNEAAPSHYSVPSADNRGSENFFSRN